MSVSMSRKTIEIAHVVIESEKPLAEVQASLETLMPAIDEEAPLLLEGGPCIFLKRDPCALRGRYGQVKSAVLYEIVSPLATSKMMRHRLAAALYAPLRVVIYGKGSTGSRIEYDLPSSLFAQFDDERVTDVAHGLDVELGRVLSAAAG